MKIAHFDYQLECGHTAVANVMENDTLRAYGQNDKITCPKCRYQKRKITTAIKSISELT